MRLQSLPVRLCTGAVVSIRFSTTPLCRRLLSMLCQCSFCRLDFCPCAIVCNCLPLQKRETSNHSFTSHQQTAAWRSFWRQDHSGQLIHPVMLPLRPSHTAVPFRCNFRVSDIKLCALQISKAGSSRRKHGRCVKRRVESATLTTVIACYLEALMSGTRRGSLSYI